jgi:hypothetical protein
MFDKISDAAEKLATNVSRRDFFVWAGKSALAVAGLLACGGIANAAGGCPTGYYACTYGYSYTCCKKGQKCCICGGNPVCFQGGCHSLGCSG